MLMFRVSTVCAVPFFIMWETIFQLIVVGLLIDLVYYFLQSNPENTVGVLTMAGKGVRVLVTPTSDLGKILACMHG